MDARLRSNAILIVGHTTSHIQTLDSDYLCCAEFTCNDIGLANLWPIAWRLLSNPLDDNPGDMLSVRAHDKLLVDHLLCSNVGSHGTHNSLSKFGTQVRSCCFSNCSNVRASYSYDVSIASFNCSRINGLCRIVTFSIEKKYKSCFLRMQ